MRVRVRVRVCVFACASSREHECVRVCVRSAVLAGPLTGICHRSSFARARTRTHPHAFLLHSHTHTHTYVHASGGVRQGGRPLACWPHRVVAGLQERGAFGCSVGGRGVSLSACIARACANAHAHADARMRTRMLTHAHTHTQKHKYTQIYTRAYTHRCASGTSPTSCRATSLGPSGRRPRSSGRRSTSLTPARSPGHEGAFVRGDARARLRVCVSAAVRACSFCTLGARTRADIATTRCPRTRVPPSPHTRTHNAHEHTNTQTHTRTHTPA